MRVALFVFALAILLVGYVPSHAQETIIFSTDLESSNGGFTHNGVGDEWEWGTPVFGVGVSAHSGSKCWGTDLDGRLDFYHDGFLTGPVIALPSITSTQKLYVSFFALVKLDCMSDRLTFYVSGDGTNWEELADLFYTMEMGYDEGGTVREFGVAEWKKYIFDVSQYAGGNLHFRFQALEPEGSDNWWGAPPHDMAGAYIDDISVVLNDGVTHNVEFTLEGWEDPSSGASCPWLVCWDGTTYDKENDIYSTARDPGNEFVDYMLVENVPLVEQDGYYKVKLSELDEEISNTDMVRLTVVDHPAGVHIGCDDNGNIFTYQNPGPPASAVSDDGNDVSTLISAKDDVGYDGFDQDYVELDFSNYMNSELAKLVVGATGFLTDANQEGMRVPPVPGFERPGIYVQTRNTLGQWESRSYFNVRFKPSTKAFDLSSYLPDPLGGYAVRLYFVSCQNNKYHRLDYVGLDTTAAAEAQVFALAPVSGTHSKRGDILNTILSSDNNYVEMYPGEETVLDFEIPQQSLQEREFVFVSEGYYLPGMNTFLIFTWDGNDWILRDAKSYTTPIDVDMSHVFDLSLFLPDPDGEYKIRIWQDYRYEDAAIDFAGLTVDTEEEALLSAWNYENNPKNADRNCTSQLSSSDNNWLDFQEYAMYGRTRIVEVKFTGPPCVSVPQVVNLDIGGIEDIYNITNPNPTVEWGFVDSENHPQAEFAVQVWTGPGATGENMWTHSETGSNTSVTYAGSPLVPGNTYFLRVRARDNESAACWSQWSEIIFRMYCGDCEPPVIVRTPATIGLSSTSQVEGQPLTIEAWITDNVSVESAKLYYRTTGTASFFNLDMINTTGSLYQGIIPAGVVLPPGVDYYLWATDGTSSTTDPLTNPAASPHQIPVVPNEAPVIVHTPVTEAPCNTNITITAQVTDNTDYVAEVRLHYRVAGDFIFTIATMTGSGTYTGTIPSSVTAGGALEYYISAADNHGVHSYAGTFDNPYVILLTGTCVAPPEVSGASVAPGTPCNVGSFTPTFSWVYYDPVGRSQSHYEVEVWSGSGGTGAGLWNPPVFSGSDNSRAYSGAALQNGQCYYFRVRVRNGVLWSSWAELRFCYDNLALVPEAANIMVGESVQFQARDGALPYTFSLSDSTICSLTIIDENTCEVTGLTEGGVILTVVDDCSKTDEASITVGDCPQPVLSLVGYRTLEYTPPFWTVQVEIINEGPGMARSVGVSMNEDIPWLGIPDASCFYGDIPAGASRWGDGDSYTFDLTNNPGGSFNVWFDVRYEDVCDITHMLRLDPEFDPGSTTGIGWNTPLSYRLEQNYPNPFNPATAISYAIPAAGNVSLRVYDVSGKLVRTLVEGVKGEGVHTVPWDGKDNQGRGVASGVYLYRMEAGSFVETKRMVFLK